MTNLIPKSALVAPGEAMKTAFQIGYIIEMALQAKTRGLDFPFHMTVGSSSGSPAAVVAAAAEPLDHSLGLDAICRFADKIRFPEILKKSGPGQWMRPYREAIEGILANDELLKWEKAFQSPTAVVIVATHLDIRSAIETWGTRFAELGEGLQRFVGDESVSLDKIAAEISTLSLAGASGLFVPCYFSTKPWPQDAPGPQPENWEVLQDADELRQVVAASTRIPPFMGMPMKYKDRVLFDGAWSDNVPAWLPPAFGIHRMFIVDCTHKGALYSRPITSYLQRQIGDTLDSTAARVRIVEQVTRARWVGRLRNRLETSRRHVKRPDPIDLKKISENFPKMEIYEDHLPQDAPNPYRFLAPKLEVIQDLYWRGVAAAKARAGQNSFP